MEEIKERVKALNEMKIDLNGDDISDVIIKDGSYYRNCMTGRETNDLDCVIRKDKRFIIFCSECIRGCYVWASDDGDAMVVVYASFDPKKARWEEMQRTPFVLGYQADTDVPSLTEDICGQAAPNIIYDKGYENNFPVVAKERAAKFFGEIYRVGGSGSLRLPGMNLRRLQRFLEYSTEEKVIYSSKFTVHMENYFSNKFSVKPSRLLKLNKGNIDLSDDWPIPEAAMPAIEKYKMLCINNLNTESADITSYTFSILQVMDGNVIQRDFIVDIEVKYPMLKSVAKIIEGRRSLLDGKYNDFPKEFVIYRDDFKGTVFECLTEPLDDCIEKAEELLQSVRPGGMNLHDFNVRMEDIMNKTYNCARYEVVALMSGLTYEWFEKLYKITKESKAVFRNMCGNCVDHFSENEGWEISKFMQEFLNWRFDGVDPQAKNLFGFLRIPKALFDSCIKNKCFFHLAKIKNIFIQTKQGEDYMMRMNKDDIEHMVSMMAAYRLRNPLARLDIIGTISKLVEIFGYKNITDYVDYICALDDEQIDVYCQYIECLNSIEYARGCKDELLKEVKNFGWKIKEKDFETVFTIINIAIEMDNNYEAYAESFSSQQDEWSKYLFESKDFAIVVPKNPKEILIEGMRLRHCAKKFISSIAEKKTLLLFVRKQEEPDKPFFTIEIKNGELRQAHGFDNCTTAAAGRNLQKFLESFCKEKCINYDAASASKLYGVI